MLSGGQFFAVLRLVVHVQSGKVLDRGLAFVQGQPSRFAYRPPGLLLISTGTQHIPHPPRVRFQLLSSHRNILVCNSPNVRMVMLHRRLPKPPQDPTPIRFPMTPFNNPLCIRLNVRTPVNQFTLRITPLFPVTSQSRKMALDDFHPSRPEKFLHKTRHHPAMSR